MALSRISDPGRRHQAFPDHLELADYRKLTRKSSHQIPTTPKRTKKRCLFTKEQAPPHFPVRDLRGDRSGRRGLSKRRSRLLDRDDRQIAILNIMPVGARPFLHSHVRARIGYLGL